MVEPDRVLLSQLRALRADLDYYIEADGWVLLLARDTMRASVAEGRNLLAKGIDTFDTRLMSDGFSILDQLPPQSAWNGQLVHRARQIMRATYKAVDHAHEALLAEIDGTNAEKRADAHMLASIHGNGRFNHAVFMRGRRSVSGRLAYRPMTEAERARYAAREAAVANRLLQQYPNIPILRSTHHATAT